MQQDKDSTGQSVSNAQARNRPVGWMMASLAFAILALGVFPPVTGGLALLFGYQAYKRDEGIGKVCMTIAGIALVIGVIIGAVWGTQNLHF